MRKYQPIWEHLKEHKTISLAADSSLHDRIIMAVYKEKNKDIGWKLLVSESGERLRLKAEKTDKMITFNLVDTPFLKLTDL